jgi:hypothetical protein
MLAQALDVELGCLSNQPLDVVAAGTGYAEPGEVRAVGAPSRRTLLVGSFSRD